MILKITRVNLRLVTKKVSSGGAGNIEKNLQTMLRYLELAKPFHKIPYLMIDNLPSEKNNEWELVWGNLERIIDMNIFSQIFITDSNESLNKFLLRKKDEKVKFINFEKHIFLK